MTTLGIGIVTYNRLQSLRETIRCVRKHTVSSYRLIVAPDGCTDGTVKWCRENGVVTFDVPRRGLTWNRNRLLYYFTKTMPVDVIMLLEDDTSPIVDNWESEWVRAAKKWGQVCYAWPGTHEPPETGEGTPDNPYLSNAVAMQCVCMTKEALAKAGYSDTRFLPPFGHEDTEWRWRYAREHGTLDGCRTPALRSGVRVTDCGTYRTKYQDVLDANFAMLESVWTDRNYHEPWRTSYEKEVFMAEADMIVLPNP